MVTVDFLFSASPMSLLMNDFSKEKEQENMELNFSIGVYFCLWIFGWTHTPHLQSERDKVSVSADL